MFKLYVCDDSDSCTTYTDDGSWYDWSAPYTFQFESDVDEGIRISVAGYSYESSGTCANSGIAMSCCK